MRYPLRTSRWSALHLILILVVLLAATALRAYRFNDWPPGLSHDEAINGLDSLRLARSGVIPFYLPDSRPEPLFRILAAGMVGLIGPTRFGLRLTSLFLGVIGVAAAYRAGRHLAPPGADPRWFGLLAAGTLAVMVGHVQLSRVAYRASVLIPAVLLFFDAFVSAWQGGRERRLAAPSSPAGMSGPQGRLHALRSIFVAQTAGFFAAGVWLAMIVMSYTSGLVVLPVAGLGILHQGLMRLESAHSPSSNKHKEGGAQFWRGLLIFGLVFLITVSPQVYLYTVQPDLYSRASVVQAGETGALLQRLSQIASSVVRTWDSFHGRGDINPQYNVAQASLLQSPWLYGLFLAGIVACLLRPRRLASILLLGLLVFGLLPVALSDEIPHGLRISDEYAAVPLIVAASAELILWGVRWLARAVPPLAGRVLRAGLPLVLGVILIGAGVQSFQTYVTYFQSNVRWGPSGEYSAFSWFFETPRMTVARLIAEKEGVTYLPLSEAVMSVMRYFTAQSHPRIQTFATYFGSDGPLSLPAGRFLLPPTTEDQTTWVAYMPDGVLVLLPRFDEATQTRLETALAASQERIFDDYGTLAATIARFPRDGSPILLEHPVAHSAGINYGDQINFVGWDGPSDLPAGGGKVTVTLYFSPGPQVHRDPIVVAQLWDINHERLASSAEGALYRWFYPPAEWQPGDVVPYLVGLESPPDLAPGAYWLALGLQDWRGRYISVIGADGTAVADVGIAATLKQPRGEAISTEGMIPARADFGDQIKLIGYRITSADGQPLETLAPGQTLIVTLYWQASRAPDTDYTIFVHIHDVSGELVAQNDSQPEGGQYPTSIWAAGEIVMTAHPITLPSDTGGPYTIYVGLYSWPSLERLSVMQNGQTVEDRRALLAELP